MSDLKAWLPYIVVGLFFVGAVVWSRFGLHRTMATMPLLPGETVLHDATGVAVVHHTGGRPATNAYTNALVRVTEGRVIISQPGLGGGDLVRAVILQPSSETAMRAGDAQAFARAGSFMIVRARTAEATRGPDGSWTVPVDPVWPAIGPAFGPAKWQFPAGTAEWVERALTAP